MLHEVGVLDRTQTDNPSDLLLLFRREGRVLFSNNSQCTLDRLFEQPAQLDVLTGTGLHHLAVLAEDTAEGDVT